MRWKLTGLIATGGLFCGAAAAYWVVYAAFGVFEGSREEPPSPPTGRTGVTGVDSVAMSYAEALQARDCGRVIELTAWMQDRVERVRLREGAEAEEAAREQLAQRIVEWKEEYNVLRREGVPDAYIIAPGSEIAPAGAPRGRAGEAQNEPGFETVWLRVTYPFEERALRDEAGRPIRSIRVGVVVNPQGRVAKRAIQGNLLIDRPSVEHSWPAEKE